ncbi:MULTISPECIES: hypothetical protein [Brevibacillus]|jgi:hypothetical protein|uniref:Uncharacterized protein n=1 Tax=Brevibacillus thermoruber TaxID=33942 RepID=A0A9X3Z2I6_9BACL|nr:MULTISPECIES: hypothetical protein [Brevibacillus]MDA5107807.1 hypothetical protein [Brevibacillus thermoruber]UYZ15100.1 hypothetical protein A6764_09295 [Brevibacillus sp. WF146]
MNRVFLVLYGLMLLASLIQFFMKRKNMPVKQRRVVGFFYLITIGLFAALQFQLNVIMPTNYLADVFSVGLQQWLEKIR